MSTKCFHCGAQEPSESVETSADHKGTLVPYWLEYCNPECLIDGVKETDWPVKPSPTLFVEAPSLLGPPLDPTDDQDLIVATIARFAQAQDGRFPRHGGLELRPATDDASPRLIITRRRSGDISALQANYVFTVAEKRYRPSVDSLVRTTVQSNVEDPTDAIVQFLTETDDEVVLTVVDDLE